VNSVAEIKRRKNESFEAYMRRVKKRWQQSGKILQVKKIQFYDAGKSKNMRRKSALHRLTVAGKINYLKKIGRLPEEYSKTFRK
jgi:ribosomal protein S21